MTSPQYDDPGSVYALALRVTRLTPAGTFAVGPQAMFVTDGLVRIDYGLAYTDGEEITKKNGAGVTCVYFKAPDTVKNLAISALEVCTPNPALTELLSGGSVFTETVGEVEHIRGYAAPEVGVDPLPNGVSVEAWTHAVVDGHAAPELPYMHWSFPRLKLRQSSNALNGSDPNGGIFEGTGEQNPNWGDGPDGEWDFSSDRVFQWRRVATLPTPGTSYLPRAA